MMQEKSIRSLLKVYEKYAEEAPTEQFWSGLVAGLQIVLEEYSP